MIVIGQAADWQAGAAYIGHANVLEADGVTVTADRAAAEDTPVRNIFDWGLGTYQSAVAHSTLSFMIGMPADAPVNSVGVYGHNLPAGSTIQVFHFDAELNVTEVALTVNSPAQDGATFFVTFEAVTTSRNWQVKITHPSMQVQVTHLFVGAAVRLYSPPGMGWVPMAYARKNELINAVSDGGQFLGRSLIRKAMQTKFSMRPVPAEWVRDNWLPFQIHAEQKPFYYAWDSANEPLDVAFCFTDKMQKPPAFVAPGQMSVAASFYAL